MKRYLIYIRTEYKRAAVLLPAVLIKAVIAALAAGMIAFCAQRAIPDERTEGLVQVGLSAPGDRLTEFAVSYIENLESVKSWCELVMTEEEEGRKLVRRGELAALLVLPDNVVEGILTGSSEPARLYLSEDVRSLGQVFEELANAGVGMLRTAQAEIYAASDLLGKQEGVQTQDAEINAFNLGLAMNRERYFRVRSLSATGGQSYAVYYGSAFFTICLLPAGLFSGRFHRRSRQEQRLLNQRLGVPIVVQLAARTLVSAGLLCLTLLPAAAFWLSEDVRQMLPVMVTGKSLTLLFLAFINAAALLQLLYQLADDKRTVLLSVAVVTAVTGYASGCFLPASLLPQAVERMGALLSAACIREAFTVFFSGRASGFAGTASALVVWTAVFWAAGWLAVGHAQPGGSGYGRRRAPAVSSAFCRIKKGSLPAILGKRTLRKKSLWTCLLLTVLLSAGEVRMERQSDTAVDASVYTADEALRRLFAEYDGLVRFTVCGSEEEVKRNVMQNRSECGYVLQENLQQEIGAGNGEWSITVYEDADAVLTNMVNEVLFERIFYAVSTDWYAGYIAEQGGAEKGDAGYEKLRQEALAALQERMTDGSTFSFERYLTGAGQGESGQEAPVFYPVRLICLLCVLSCGAIGVLEAAADRRARRFFGKPKALTAAFTVLWPTLLGAAAAFAVLLVTELR